jgi:hypothetical protein
VWYPADEVGSFASRGKTWVSGGDDEDC